jgi:hypothetical protein
VVARRSAHAPDPISATQRAVTVAQVPTLARTASTCFS